ncbi:MAG: pyridoxal phosphate-dependent aminotransferase [Thermoprotei archaeon]|nr:MAG: pyridoxal phosphate-dependent aminotransferase [Thermoprotei archaeon]
MKKISQRVQVFKPSPHRKLVGKVDELLRAGRDVYNYSAGQPGIPPSMELIDKFCEGAHKDPFNHFRYMSTRGMPALKEAISEDLKKYGGIDIPPSNIVVTSGGVEAFNLALATTTDPGDEVFILDPAYSVYWDLAKYLGLKVNRCLQPVENVFQPDEECIKEKLTKKTAAAIIISPDNPTSRIIDEGVMKLIADLAQDNDVWLIYDEAYKHVIYEGAHVWIHRYGDTLSRLVSVNSFSKDIAIPGFRLGYAYAPKELIEEMVKLKGITSISSSVPAQWFAYHALTTDIKEKYLKEVLPIYRSRRDVAYDAFRKYLPEAKVWRPPASMYLFPDMSPYLDRIGMDDIEFTYRLADEKAVVMLPGSIFGEAGKKHLRVTFVTQPEDRLRRGIELLAEFIEELEKKK